MASNWNLLSSTLVDADCAATSSPVGMIVASSHSTIESSAKLGRMVSPALSPVRIVYPSSGRPGVVVVAMALRTSLHPVVAFLMMMIGEVGQRILSAFCDVVGGADDVNEEH